MLELKPYVRKVNYYETDQMHVVHHSNYARYIEEARLDLMEQVGLSYDKMEELGIIIPVLELHNQYIKSATYGDTLVIYPVITKLTAARFSLTYEIFNMDTNELINRSETSHAFVDTNFKPMNMKRNFPDLYSIMESHVGESYHKEQL